jgi:hypothetical protein
VTSAEKYATAAYAVVLAVVLLYIVLYAFKLSRLQREVGELAKLAARRRADADAADREPERVA